MSNWWEGPLATFDLETTGLDVLEDRIVQAALLIIEADGTTRDGGWSGLINPGVAIPPESTEIHDITDEMVQRDGVPAEQALPQIAEVFAEYSALDLPLVIYNAPFDWPFIHAEASRYGTSIPWMDIIDPLVCDRALDKFRSGSRTLASNAAMFGIPLVAHTAAADATAAAAVMRELAVRHETLRNTPVTVLQGLQSQWHFDWAGGYETYLKNSGGQDDAHVDKHWPTPERAKHLRYGSKRSRGLLSRLFRRQ
jgi:DNA polymerase-3 subunit epsilon